MARVCSVACRVGTGHQQGRGRASVGGSPAYACIGRRTRAACIRSADIRAVTPPRIPSEAAPHCNHTAKRSLDEWGLSALYVGIGGYHDRIVSMPAPDSEDLTARARIRNAALRLFAERGVEGATIRDIAKAAGVSLGLVRHHFGSKDALRAACDTYALGRIMEIKEQAVLAGGIVDPGSFSAAQPAMLPLLNYLARSAVDGSPAADKMFDEMVGMAETWLADHHTSKIRDRRAYAALLIAMELGGLVMREQLSRVLGSDVLEPEGHLRLLSAKIDFYSRPVLSAKVAEQAHTALDRLQLPRVQR